MTFNAFVVEELSELLVLQRIFREAKFCIEPDDTEISDSPIVANLFEKLVTVIIKQESEIGGSEAKQRWERWLQIDDSRDEWHAAIRRARVCDYWWKLTDSDRVDYVKTLLSPFYLSSELVVKFIYEVNQSRAPEGAGS